MTNRKRNPGILKNFWGSSWMSTQAKAPETRRAPGLNDHDHLGLGKIFMPSHASINPAPVPQPWTEKDEEELKALQERKEQAHARQDKLLGDIFEHMFPDLNGYEYQNMAVACRRNPDRFGCFVRSLAGFVTHPQTLIEVNSSWEKKVWNEALNTFWVSLEKVHPGVSFDSFKTTFILRVIEETKK